MPDTNRANFRVAVLAYFAAWGLLAAPWLLGYVTIPYDAKAHFQAQIQFLAHALHTGQSPFWAPHVFGGSPQIADPQSMIFSPAILLAWLVPDPSFRAVDAYVLGLLGIGGLGILGLFRERGWHPAGGIVAALAFAFGASAAWRVQHIGQVQSYALFAIVLFLLDRALRRSSAPYGAAAGLAAGAMLVEPDQVALLACYLLTALVIERWLRDGAIRRNIRETLPALACGTIAGLAVAGLPLVMTYLFVAESTRPQIALAEAMRGSLHPASLLTLFVSDLFGAHDPKVEYWGPFSEAWDPSELTLSQNMSQLYVGALPVLLAISVGFVRGRLWAREVRLFTLVALAFTAYALGRHTPFYQVLYDWLPGVSFFRRPADATFMLGSMLAIVAGYVLHRHLTDEVGPRRTLRFGAGTLIIPAMALAIALLVAATVAKVQVAWWPVLVATFWLTASLLVLTHLPGVSRRWAGAAVVVPAALLAADLAANNGPNESTALPAAQYEVLEPLCKNPTMKLLKSWLKQPPGSERRDRVELAGLGFEWPNASLVHGIDHVLGYNPLRLDVVSKAIGAGDTIAGPDQRHFTPLFPSYRSKLADLLGLRYIATSVPIEAIDTALPEGGLPLVARTADAYIYENENALPRAMLIDEWRLADFDRILRTGRWPTDPARTLLLEALPVRAVSPAPAIGQAQSDLARGARIVRYENTIVHVDVDSPRPTFLVLNDVWHPWWEAEVDGRPVPILKGNVLFRAVELPAGRHAVHFEFRPVKKVLEHVAQSAASAAYQLSLIPSVRAEPRP